MCTYHDFVYDALHYLEAVQVEAEQSMFIMCIADAMQHMHTRVYNYTCMY